MGNRKLERAEASCEYTNTQGTAAADHGTNTGSWPTRCDLLPSKDGQAAYEQAANLVWNLLDSDILLQGLAREGKGPREKVGSSVTQYVGVVEGLTWLATAIERSRKASRPGSR